MKPRCIAEASEVSSILVATPRLERPINSWVWSIVLRKHCVDGSEQLCFQSGNTQYLPQQQALQRHVAGRHACSSSSDAGESLEVPKALGQMGSGIACEITLEHCIHKEQISISTHSDGANSAGERVLNTLPLIITESIASGGHGTSLQLGKEKGFFPPKRMISLKRSSVYLMTGPNYFNKLPQTLTWWKDSHR